MISVSELPQLHSDSIPEQPKSIESLRMCLITLGEETFAIDLRQVSEVFEPESITAIPGMPIALIGVTNLRGTIIPIADIRAPLGVVISVVPRYAVVVRSGTQQVGILAEEVPEIVTIHSNDLVAPLTHIAAERRPLLSAFFRIQNTVGAILEISRLLASIEGAVDEPSS